MTRFIPHLGVHSVNFNFHAQILHRHVSVQLRFNNDLIFTEQVCGHMGIWLASPRASPTIVQPVSNKLGRSPPDDLMPACIRKPDRDLHRSELQGPLVMLCSYAVTPSLCTDFEHQEPNVAPAHSVVLLTCYGMAWH